MKSFSRVFSLFLVLRNEDLQHGLCSFIQQRTPSASLGYVTWVMNHRLVLSWYPLRYAGAGERLLLQTSQRPPGSLWRTGSVLSHSVTRTITSRQRSMKWRLIGLSGTRRVLVIGRTGSLSSDGSKLKCIKICEKNKPCIRGPVTNLWLNVTSSVGGNATYVIRLY